MDEMHVVRHKTEIEKLRETKAGQGGNLFYKLYLE